MGTLTPSGHVIEGKYIGKEVYVWEENQSLMIHDGLLKNGTLFGSPTSCQLCKLTASSIMDYQDMGSATQNANPEAVMKVGFWFGAVAAVAANQIGTQEIHTVAIEYTNGERSLLELNSFAYRTFKSIAFIVDDKKRKMQAEALCVTTDDEHNDKSTIAVSVPTKLQETSAKKQIRINTDNLGASIKRAFMFLEDGEWDIATEYFETILDMDPERAEAYLGLTLANNKCHSKEEFESAYIDGRIENDNKNLKRARQFADKKAEKWFDEIDGKRKAENEKRKAEEERKSAENKKRLSSIREKILKYSDVSAGGYHTVGLKSDGTVVATKLPRDSIFYYGQCDISDWTDIVAISANTYHTVGLKSDGTVVATEFTGDKKHNHGQCDTTDWTDIVAISAGYHHTVGLKSDGTVVATEFTGDKEFYHGQCDVTDWSDIVAISADNFHTVGLKSDGTVVATEFTGDKEYYSGQCDIADWTDIVAISTGEAHTVGLKSDGTVVATEFTDDKKYYNGQCDVSDWKDIMAISAGVDHTVGLKQDGTVVATEFIGDKKYYTGLCDVSDWKLFKTEKEKYADYVKACALQKSGEENNLAEAAVIFSRLKDYQDSPNHAVECYRVYKELKAERESREKAEREAREAREQAERAEAQKKVRQKRIASLNSERSALQNELANLKGLFTGKRRKQIDIRFAQIDNELKELYRG